ncbi:MAG: hypothetical protein LBK27_05700, partial [Treponema sp.]|nr:hypothetical protein [Treponema sp.]
MKIPFLFRFSSPVILLVFTFVSCSSPFFAPRPSAGADFRTEIASIPLGVGNPVFLYLDSNYQPTAADSSRTALVVENNEMASGVLVLAEVPEDDLANGSVVRVINTNNGSMVSMFYYENQKFPHKMTISKDDRTVQAQFSVYNMEKQNFSLFLEGEGEYATLDDLTMNSKVLTLYTFQDTLNESQNVRVQNIITSLAIWDCIAMQLPGSDFIIAAAGWWNSFIKTLLIVVFAVVAVAAFVATIIVAGPAAISVVGFVITIALETPLAAALAATAVVAAATSVFLSKIPVDEIEDQEASTAPDPKPQTIIKKAGGTEVPNGNWDSPYYLEPGSSMTFDLQFSIAQSPALGKFDPVNLVYGDPPFASDNHL